MRPAPLFAVLLAATSAGADDDERAFVELTAPRDTYFVGEPIRLRLQFGVDAEFLRTSVVPLFQRELDIPVQVEVPSFRGLPGAAAADAAARLTFALNDGAAAAAPVDGVVRGGRAFTVCETQRTVVPDRAGEVAVAAPALRFAFATRFDEDDLRGRVALDRQDVVVTGAAPAIRVLPLPDAGRPAGFAGAVGRFSVRAATDAAEAVVGEPFLLTLTVEGEGNLSALAVPRLDGLEGFRVVGAIDAGAAGPRRFRYEIEPLRAGVRGVPPIPFAYFDTTPPAQYRVAQTSPIPLVVRPSADGAPVPVAADADPARPAGGRTAVLVVAVAAAVAAALIAARRRAAAREQAPAHPVPAAMAALRTDVVAGDPGAAFAAFLGACLGVPAASVIAPDIAERLVAAGVPADAGARAAALLDGLVAARYGGGPATGDARAAVLASGAEVAAALGSAARPPERSA